MVGNRVTKRPNHFQRECRAKRLGGPIEYYVGTSKYIKTVHGNEQPGPALRTHLQVVQVQDWGCRALLSMCDGTDVAAQARNKCAAKEEAIEAVLSDSAALSPSGSKGAKIGLQGAARHLRMH